MVLEVSMKSKPHYGNHNFSPLANVIYLIIIYKTSLRNKDCPIMDPIMDPINEMGVADTSGKPKKIQSDFSCKLN